jgi:threonine/homoserine/homoserine lactone efflux protein
MVGMTGWAAAGLAGVGAGLGVAMPLGAVGVLLLQEAITSGWRPAAGGAFGVAVVDLSYAVLALLAGAAVTRGLHGHERAVELAGAAILTAVAAWGVSRLGRPAGPALPEAAAASPWPVAGRFILLTAVNPLTAIYFVAFAAGSAGSGGAGSAGSAGGLGRAVAFATGVFLASLAWQLVLATIGAVAGHRLGGRARLLTGGFGYLIVLGYAARLALGAG